MKLKRNLLQSDIEPIEAIRYNYANNLVQEQSYNYASCVRS